MAFGKRSARRCSHVALSTRSVTRISFLWSDPFSSALSAVRVSGVDCRITDPERTATQCSRAHIKIRPAGHARLQSAHLRLARARTLLTSLWRQYEARHFPWNESRSVRHGTNWNSVRTNCGGARLARNFLEDRQTAQRESKTSGSRLRLSSERDQRRTFVGIVRETLRDRTGLFLRSHRAELLSAHICREERTKSASGRTQARQTHCDLRLPAVLK